MVITNSFINCQILNSNNNIEEMQIWHYFLNQYELLDIDFHKSPYIIFQTYEKSKQIVMVKFKKLFRNQLEKGEWII